MSIPTAHRPPIGLDERVATALAGIAHRHAVAFLALHGSRVRGDARPDSDWDLAARPGPDTDWFAFAGEVEMALAPGTVDLAHLGGGRHPGPSLVFAAAVAQEGVPLYEAAPGAWADWVTATLVIWFDAGPAIEAGSRAFLRQYARAHGAG